MQSFLVNLYKEYTSLKSKELEELPRFRVMSWQLCHMLCSALNCIQVTLYYCKGIKIIWQAIKIGYILSLVK